MKCSLACLLMLVAGCLGRAITPNRYADTTNYADLTSLMSPVEMEGLNGYDTDGVNAASEEQAQLGPIEGPGAIDPRYAMEDQNTMGGMNGINELAEPAQMRYVEQPYGSGTMGDVDYFAGAGPAEAVEEPSASRTMAGVEDPQELYPAVAMEGSYGQLEAVGNPTGPGSMNGMDEPVGPAGDQLEVMGYPGSSAAAEGREEDKLIARALAAVDGRVSGAYYDEPMEEKAVKVAKREEAPEDDSEAEMRQSAPRARGCGMKTCGGRDSVCQGSVNCDPSGANSPACQQKTTQLAQEAACEAQAAAAAQQAAGIQASNQVRAQLAEKACQASNSAQAALAGKQAMLDFLMGELAETQALLESEKKELGDSDNNEHLIKDAVCASQQLAKNVAITAQQAANLACLLDKIDLSALNTEDEESALLIATQKKVEQLAGMVEDARRDVEATCAAAKQAAAAAQASRQNAMRNRRKTRFPPQAYIAKLGKNAL